MKETTVFYFNIVVTIQLPHKISIDYYSKKCFCINYCAV